MNAIARAHGDCCRGCIDFFWGEGWRLKKIPALPGFFVGEGLGVVTPKLITSSVDGFITQETAPCGTRGSSQPGKQKARKWTHNPRTSSPDRLRCARERATGRSHPISSCRQGLYWRPQELRLKHGNFSKLHSGANPPSMHAGGPEMSKFPRLAHRRV